MKTRSLVQSTAHFMLNVSVYNILKLIQAFFYFLICIFSYFVKIYKDFEQSLFYTDTLKAEKLIQI